MDFLKNTPVLYINLQHREDRRIRTVEQFNCFNIEPQRFDAILSRDGALGCSQSHLRCLQIAKEKHWERVFICEDDIFFTNPTKFIETLDKFIVLHNDWDVLLVSGNNFYPFNEIDDTCIQVFNCQTATGYIVKASYYDKLIDNFIKGITLKLNAVTKDEEHMYCLDQYWKHLQKIDKWFFLIPPTIIQIGDYSDIEHMYVDYSKSLLVYNKA